MNVYQLTTNTNFISKLIPDQAKNPPIRTKPAVKSLMYSGNTLVSSVEQSHCHLFVDSEAPGCASCCGVLLRHAVGLLVIHQAGLVRLQDPERRVVLKGCEDGGAEILLLVQEPNTSGDPNNSDHADDDQDGQHRAGH